jgi:TRAP-type C4-dicarboxylate transport system permease small subunit
MWRYLNRLETSFNWLTLVFAILVAVSIGMITLLIPLNLALINLDLGGIWWLYEAVEYALYVGVFIAAPWVLHQGAHVRVDVLVTAMPDTIARKLDQFVNLIGIILCTTLMIYGLRATLSEFADGTLPDKDLRIANWYMIGVFTFAFLLLAVEFLFRLLRSIRSGEDDDGTTVRAGF